MRIHYDFKDILQKIVDIYGEESQMLMAVEEMSELTKEICKSINRTADNSSAIQDEAADVLITVLQVAEMVGYDKVMERIAYKIDRFEQKHQSSMV